MNSGMNEPMQSVYEFWFGDVLHNPGAADRHTFWFMGGTTVDQQIREQFEPLVHAAQAGELPHWQDTAQGSLALIILLDQFPLNMYRGSARAYLTARHAVSVCLNGIARGQDQELSFYERMFFYLPLEHSEATEHQQLSIRYFTRLRNTAPQQLIAQAEDAVQYALSHKAVIDRFGRYPHRNEALGRTSTAAERAYLETGGARYGQ